MRNRSPIMNSIIKSVDAAGNRLRRDSNEITHLVKSVKKIDRFINISIKKTEEVLSDRLLEARPAYGIYFTKQLMGGELVTLKDKEDNDGAFWFVEPLYGRTDFAHGLEGFGIAILVMVNGVSSMGLCYKPLDNTMHTIEENEGGMVNDQRMRVNPNRFAQDASIIVESGHSFKNQEKNKLATSIVGRLSSYVFPRYLPQNLSHINYLCEAKCNGVVTIDPNYFQRQYAELFVRSSGGVVTYIDYNDQKIMLSGNADVVDQLSMILA